MKNELKLAGFTEKFARKKVHLFNQPKGCFALRAHHPYSAAKSKQQSETGKTCTINELYCIREQMTVNIN